MTVDEAYRKWQNEYWFDSRNILEKTINGYISMFDRHIIPIIGKEDISSIDCTKIQKHYDELSENGYSMIDCQFHTDHLESMGGERISYEEYVKLLRLGGL